MSRAPTSIASDSLAPPHAVSESVFRREHIQAQIVGLRKFYGGALAFERQPDQERAPPAMSAAAERDGPIIEARAHPQACAVRAHADERDDDDVEPTRIDR